MKMVLLQSSNSNTPEGTPRRSSKSSPSATRKQEGKSRTPHNHNTAIEEIDEEAMADAAAGGGAGGDQSVGQSHGEEMTEEQKAKERQDKIVLAQFEGWKNSCKRLRQTADKLEKEHKQLALANKELKLLLQQALDGETKSPGLSNLVVKRITKSRLNTENDLLELLAK